MSHKQEIRRAYLMRQTLGMETCGKHSNSQYVKGCRCDACREANRIYAREYARRSRERVAEAASRVAAKEREESRGRAEAMHARLMDEVGI